MAGAVEAMLRQRDPGGYLRYLLMNGRDDEVWHLSQQVPDVVSSLGLWRQVCAIRARSHPEEVIDVYRDLVADLLTVADVHRYRVAAALLVDLRAAPVAVGEHEEARFVDYVRELRAANTRRSRLQAILSEVGL